MIKVIVVEDDPMVSHINQLYLRRLPDIKVTAALASGQEALAYLLENEVDLVILDVYIPDISGIELLRRTRLDGLRVDVIVVTAANEARQVEEVLRLGVVDYLVKPFTETRFMEAMVKYLAKKETLKAGDELKQWQIDRLLGSGSLAPQVELPKGLQLTTWNLILGSLAKAKGRLMSCEEVAVEVGLSKVTIRRYLRQMVAIDLVDSHVDYETGGRPRLRYRSRETRELKAV
ncbi:MAG: response regulator [Deltaproteobacteria bacterium]|jgi:response regulator of citrate/malate metabolism|nr:response regulator [Deltaproteobacteria bacterium]